MSRLTKAWVGRCVDFSGYDGKRYTAHVDRVRNGIAIITYFVTLADGTRQETTAYVGVTTWAERINQPAQVSA